MVEVFERMCYTMYREVDHLPLIEGALHKHSQMGMCLRERSDAIKECLYS
jgi:hypothetical protein